jgi:glycosyltransferase involved in cell wall biosynthesis
MGEGELGPPSNITVDTMVPVYNERHALARSIEKLHDHLVDRLPYDWRIVIVENGSTDGTLQVAEDLCRRFGRLELLRVKEKGRGRALRTAWLCSRADVVSYMDVDLSSSLDAYYALVRAVAEDGYDLATGRRFGQQATVVGRKLNREVLSRTHNLVTRFVFGTKVVDNQCGFKAMSRASAQRLLPRVADDGWFFDTELLVRAEKEGSSIKQVPVYWTDDPTTHLRILPAASQYLQGLWRLKREGY